MDFLMIKVYFQISEFESSIFWQFNNFIVKLRKNVLTEKLGKKNWGGQYSEMLYWTSNGQFKSKIDLPFEKLSKITRGALTNIT